VNVSNTLKTFVWRARGKIRKSIW